VRRGARFRLRQIRSSQAGQWRGPGGQKLKLASVSNNAPNFWSFARAGCNSAAAEPGDVDLDFRITQDGSSATQRQILDGQAG